MDKEIKNAVIALESGETILYPTDTVWGIGCNALSDNATKKIFELKKREYLLNVLKVVIGRQLDLFLKFSHLAIMVIFKLFRIEEWQQFEAQGKTNGAPIDVMDGFIHFSKASPVKETAAKL